jgi:hypothetical protein
MLFFYSPKIQLAMKSSSLFYHIDYYHFFNSVIINFLFFMIKYFIYDMFYLITLIVQQPIKIQNYV